MHKPLGRYIFNNVAFSKYDPLVEKLKEAGYNVFNHPYDDTATLVTFPVDNSGVDFAIVDGKEVNMDSAVSQLETYKMLMDSYCQQNVSCTISYSIDETSQIVDWLFNNWNSYVAVSFLFRNDPSKTAADLGYPYLPQEVTTKELYDSYVARLKPVDVEFTKKLETKNVVTTGSDSYISTCQLYYISICWCSGIGISPSDSWSRYNITGLHTIKESDVAGANNTICKSKE
jgi:hypothetical protein